MTVGLKIHIEPLPEGMWADGKRVDAFEAVYRRCYPQLVDLCRRSLCGRGDPEAVAQEAFVRAWSSLDRFSGARPFWPWVATIARRLCIDHRRRLERENLHLHVAAAINERDTAAPDEVLEIDEDYRSVLTALQRLKPSEQRVITLRDVNGWTYDEIARFEGVTVESIRGSLKRARASLRKSFAKVAAGAPVAVPIRSWQSLRARLWRSVGSAQRHVGLAGRADAVSQLAVGIAAAVVALGAVVPAPSTGVRGKTEDGLALSAPAVANEAALDADAQVPGTTGGSSASADGARPAPSASPTGSSPGSLLLDDGVQVPEDAVVTEITYSPSYQRDGTVFVSGTAARNCPHVTCPVLFRSHDRGASWHRLQGTGLVGGNVLLPPTYPADPRIFVAANNLLQVSTDDGASFSGIAPVGGASAISPTFPDDGRILLGQAPGWEYRDDLEAMRPSGLVTGSTALSAIPVFSPAYGDDATVFVGGTAPTVGGTQVSAVFRCVDGFCRPTPARLTGPAGPPSIAVSPDVADDGLVLAWRGRSLFRSSDTGESFEPVALPAPGVVRSVAIDRRYGIVVAVRDVAGSTVTGALLRSVDGGRTWSVLAEGPLARGVESVAVLPDGRLLAGVASTGGGGLWCSLDGGVSWSRRCGS